MSIVQFSLYGIPTCLTISVVLTVLANLNLVFGSGIPVTYLSLRFL